MSTLQRASFSGSLWMGISVLVASVVQLLQMSLVTHQLSTGDVGTVAASLVVLALADTIATMGVANSIIQRQHATRNELTSLYWLNFFIGCATALVLWLVAPWFAWFFRNPDLTVPVQIIGLSFLLSPLGQVPRGILERDLQFRMVAGIEVVTSVLMLATTFVALTLGLGVASVPLAYAVSVSVRAVCFLVAARAVFVPRLHFRLHETRRFLSFGIVSSIDVIVGFMAANVGSFAVGRMVSPTALGGYNLAFTYAVNTPARLNSVVTRVAFPAMSQLQNEQDRRSRAIRRVINAVIVVNAPILLTLAIAAEPFVSVFFGSEWLWTVPLFHVLAGVGLTRAMGNPMGAILMALNKMGVGLAVNVVKSTVHVLVVIAGAYFGGALGAAYAALVMGVVTIIVNIVLLRCLAQIPILSGCADHVRPLLLSVPLLAVGIATASVCSLLSGAPFVNLLVISAVCLATYAATLVIVRHPLVSEVRRFLPGGR